MYACRIPVCGDALHQINRHRNAIIVLLGLGNLVRFPPLPFHIHIPLRNSVWPFDYPLQRQHALGFNLGHAYEDLHRISFPGRAVCVILNSSNRLRSVYNSRQNDIVRHFLLERLQEIAKDHDFIHIEDDVQTNAVFLNGSRAVCFEGNNILVKVHGIDNVAESKCFVDVEVVFSGFYSQSYLII
jgi:hypothetical protein